MDLDQWLQSDLQKDIWKKKYQHNNETLEDFFDRVSGGNEEIRQLMVDKKFLAGGRILANRGLNQLGKKITYSNCFVERSKVITKRGLINIEEVQIGDYVITENNTWQYVNNVMSRDYSGDLYEFKSHSFYDDIVCTPNHQLLTQNGWKRADKILACSEQVINPDRLKIADFKFEKKYNVVDFTEGFIETNKTNIEYLQNNKIQIRKTMNMKGTNCNRLEGNPVNRYANMDEDFRYFVGRWLGDGSITRRRGKRNSSILQIVFNKEKEEKMALRIIDIGEKIFGIKPSVRYTKQNIIAVRFENEIIGTWFFNEFGQKCDSKHLDHKYMGDLIIALGLLDADSNITTHGSLKIVLKNKQLIFWLRDTLYLNGINTSSIKRVEKYEGHYQITICSSIVKGRLTKLLNKSYYDQRMNLCEIRDFFKNYIEITNINLRENVNCKVYNLSVENNHTYSVNGVIVHNCYVISPPEDSIESIFEGATKLARTYSYGGGCGIDISQLSPKGAKINNAANETTGSVSFMELYSIVTSLIGQEGRRGALMISIDCHHPDLLDFINIKNDLNKINKANLSIRITNDFMNAVKTDSNFDLKFTRIETGETIIKTIKAREIFRKFAESNWKMAEPAFLMWDRITSWNLLSEDKNFKFAGVNPCAEEPLPAGGSCLLGSINLSEYVSNPFSENAVFESDLFANDIADIVEYMNEVLDEGLPLHPLVEQRESVKNWRQIGIGIMGLADMFIKVGIAYGSSKSLEIADYIGSTMINNALYKSAKLAKKYGTYPMYNSNAILASPFYKTNADIKTKDIVEKYGLRNSQLLTCAPTGSISTMLGISGGIEPIYENSYTRKTESLHGKDEYYKVFTPIVQDYMKQHNIKNEKELPHYFVTAMSLNYKDRISMQSVWQRYIDASISSTVNVPEDFTVEQVEDLYMTAWEKGLKGITMFRNNCERVGILTTDNKAETKKDNDTRGYIDNVPEGLVYRKYKLTTGCGALYFFLGIDEKDNKIYDCFCNTDGTSGCNVNTQAVSRLVSAGLRGGIPVEYLIKQLDKAGVCPSFQYKRGKGEKLSEGKSCASAIANVIKNVIKEFNKNDSKKEVKEAIKNVSIKAEDKPVFYECPECHQITLVKECGCDSCRSCGFSKCL